MNWAFPFYRYKTSTICLAAEHQQHCSCGDQPTTTPSFIIPQAVPLKGVILQFLRACCHPTVGMLFAYNNPQQNIGKHLWWQRRSVVCKILSLIQGMASTTWLAFTEAKLLFSSLYSYNVFSEFSTSLEGWPKSCRTRAQPLHWSFRRLTNSYMQP